MHILRPWNGAIIAVSVRAVGLLGRLFVVIILARTADPSVLASFGILQATIGILIYFLGLEYYLVLQRKLIQTPHFTPELYISSILRIFLKNYLIALPLVFMALAAWQGVSLASIFVAILVGEHIGQEYYRFFIASRKALLATALLALRTGLWGFFLPLFLLFDVEDISLVHVLALWGAAQVLVILVSIMMSPTAAALSSRRPALRSRLWDILPEVRIFLPIAILTTVLQFIDRLMAAAMLGDAEVASFVFYSSIANSVYAFGAAGITNFLLPKIVSLQSSSGNAAAIGWSFLGHAAIGMTVLLFVIPVLDFIDRPNYEESYYLLFLLMPALILRGVSDIWSLAIYARGRERWLVGILLIACACGGILQYALILPFGVFGCASATLASITVLATLRYAAYRNCVNDVSATGRS